MGIDDVSSQRRHLTVVMFDIVGSTSLSEEVDPEEVARLLGDYQRICETRISELQGAVLNIVADEVAGCFGWPVAKEASAERALRCARAVIHDVMSVRAAGCGSLMLRVGIATGLVVARESRGGSMGLRREVIGTAPNLAARLQARGQPGEILLCAATAALLRDRFELEPVGPLTLKGLSGNVDAFVYRREKPHAGLLAEGMPTSLPLERQAKVVEIRRLWRQATRGRGRVAIVAGEAGMGKSTLARAFLREVEREASRIFVLQCSSFYKDTPLYPVARMLRDAWGLDDSLDEAANLARLAEAMDRNGFEAADERDLIADVLTMAAAGAGKLTSSDSPRMRRARTLELLARHIAKAAADGPVAVLIEDAHWADPTTREFIHLAVERFKDTAILVIVTTRPPVPAALASLGRQVRLEPLSHAALTALVSETARGLTLPSTVLDAIARRTDGIPLHVIELVKSLLEDGKLVDTGNACILRVAEDELDIPLSLSDVLNSRIDQAGDDKPLLQAAACLGREFTVPLLRAVAELPAGSVMAGLSRLEEVGLIQREDRPGDTVFRFRHSLVQQAAHRSLLRTRSEALHSRIADLLPRIVPGVAAAHPEILARHLVAADRPVDALPHCERAGELAAARSAYFEAVAHFDRALELAKALASADLRARTELRLLVQLGPALMALRGYADETVGRTYDRAVELLDAPQADPADAVPALFGQWTFHVVGNRLDRALAVGERVHAGARALQDESLVLEAHVLLGVTHFVRGSVAESVRNCRAARAAYDPVRHRAHSAVFGQEPGMAAAAFLASGLWWLGEEARALEAAAEAVRLAEESRHPFSQAFCAAVLARLHMLRGDADMAASFATRAAEISRVQVFPVWSATAEIILGWSMAKRGAPRADAVSAMRGAIEAYSRLGSALSAPVYQAMLLELELEDLDPRAACRRIADIRHDAETSEGMCDYAEILRVEARALRNAGDADGADRLLKRALDHATEASARAYAVPLAIDLGESLLLAGRERNAVDLVTFHAARVEAVPSSPHVDLRVRDFIERARQHR